MSELHRDGARWGRQRRFGGPSEDWKDNRGRRGAGRMPERWRLRCGRRIISLNVPTPVRSRMCSRSSCAATVRCCAARSATNGMRGRAFSRHCGRRQRSERVRISGQEIEFTLPRCLELSRIRRRRLTRRCGSRKDSPRETSGGSSSSSTSFRTSARAALATPTRSRAT